MIAVVLAAASIGAGAAWYLRSEPQPPAASPPAAPALDTPPPPHAALPRMQVQAQYGGPLQDTLIQRLRDPLDGTICYVYLPIAVHHTPPSHETGYVEYGANTVGAISCFAPLVLVRVAAPPPRPQPQ
ncbi:MAG TPA: hypothetical protein VNU97_12585 [Rhizomicrobium sp.]|jgi:hypothetical protein|nr:hypothetical protein [Rhizomicrobium sp.]